jgi:hypothetical protein
VSIPSSPPDILPYNDLRALLYHARDDPAQSVPDTAPARRDGWRKMCLFALYFECSKLEVPSPPDGTLKGAVRFFRSAISSEMPREMQKLGWAGFFAWRWRRNWTDAFERLKGRNGRPVVPPILQVGPPHPARALITAVAWPLSPLILQLRAAFSPARAPIAAFAATHYTDRPHSHTSTQWCLIPCSGSPDLALA